MHARGFTAEDIYAVARMIGLPAREKTLRTVAAMDGLHDAAKNFIAERNLPLPVVEQLLLFDGSEIEGLVSMMSALNVTSSYLREALNLLMLIKVRQGRIDLTQWAGARDMEALIRELKRVDPSSPHRHE